jgi:MFS superfamily sulfate permease-like transporter
LFKNFAINNLGSFNWQDAIAGLSIAGLLLPEAVAYSSIGNMPPQAGIIALFAGLLCYGLFGTSRFAIVSATSSSAAVLAAAAISFANIDVMHRMMLSFGLIIITGLLFLVAGLARMGKVTDFISKPVLRGFAFGLAIVIIMKQFASMAGIHASDNNLFLLMPELFGQISKWNSAGITIGVIALALLFLFSRFQRLPGGLIVIALGILCSQWLNISQYHVQLVGTIHLQLETPTLPLLSQEEWLRLGELGFAMVMILYSESYSSIRVFAMKHGDDTSPDRDLLALGLSNLVAGLFHGMPVGAGYSGTSANEAAGATSHLSGLYASLVVLAVVLTILPSIAMTPEPILAAIVIHAVSHTLSLSIFRPYILWRRDRLVILASVIGVLWLGVLDGLLAAIGISLMMVLRKSSESAISVLGQLGQGHDFVDIENHPEAKPMTGVIILRPDEPLFFANAERILNGARQTTLSTGSSVHSVIISLEESPDLDSTCLEALQDFFEFISKQEKLLILARLKYPVHQILKRLLPSNQETVLLTELSVDDAVILAQDRNKLKPLD